MGYLDTIGKIVGIGSDVAGIVGSLGKAFGAGDGASGNSTTVARTSPAPWEPADKELFDLFFTLFGGTDDMMGYLQRLQEDMGVQKAAYEKFNQGMAGYTDDRIAEGQRLTRPTLTLNVAGQAQNFVPRGNFNVLGELDRQLALREAAGMRDLTVDTTFTPNSPYFQFMQVLMPLVDKIQGRRYGLPSTTTTETGELTGNTSLLDRMRALQTGGDSLLNIITKLGSMTGSRPVETDLFGQRPGV